MVDEFRDIDITKIKSIENVRTNIKDSGIATLMASIKQQGLLEPVGVWYDNKEKTFIIIYGHRRLEACKKLGWKTIIAKVYDGKVGLLETLLMNTSENMHRKDISISELGRMIALLKKKFNMGNEEIAVKLGVSSSVISQAHKIFNSHMPLSYRDKIVYTNSPTDARKQGKIPTSVYTAFLGMRREYNLNVKDSKILLDATVRESLSVSQMKVVGSLLSQGATLKDALRDMGKYNIIRITLAVNTEIEKKLIKESNLTSRATKSELYSKILNGKISGVKNLVFNPENRSF
jgi:ParB/RepB/Spo0J family partition protein